MRSLGILFFAVIPLLGACGGGVQRDGAALPSASVHPIDSEPTVLSDTQKRRDAAAAPRVEAILDAYENVGPVLSPNGKTILFLSDRGGVPELYLGEVARPDDAPTKIASGPERVASAVFTRDGAAVLYRKDTGADENFHIYRVAIDGTGTLDLTPSEVLWRDHPLLPAAKPHTMVYSARKKNVPDSSILVQEIAKGDPKVVYTSADPGVAVDVSPDGARALFVSHGMGGHTLTEVDLTTSKAKRLYPAEGKLANIGTAAYAIDGQRVFVSTDGGKEAFSVLAIDRQSSATVAEYTQDAHASAAIGSVVPSPRGDVVAVLMDAGNHTTVRLLDANTLAARADLKTPLGTASLGTLTEVFVPSGGGTFSSDGTRFVIGLSLPDAPSDVYLVDPSTADLTPLRKDKRAGLEQLPPLATSIENVPAFDGLTIPVNVYLPKDLKPGRRLPTLISFHGGPDGSESIAWGPWTRVFTSAGFAVLEPNIRGSTGFGRAYEKADDRAKRVDAMKDVGSVNAWARSQPWCDPTRLVIKGGSYGGYVVLMGLTRQPTLWNAGVDLAGISDLPSMAKYAAESGGVRMANEFGDVVKDAQLLQELSPLRDVAKIVAPLFVYQGQNDTRVPRSQADTIVRALRQRHISVEYMVAPNEGHTVDRRDNQVEFLTRVLRFLHDELKVAD